MTTDYETINQRLIGELKAQRRGTACAASIDPMRRRDADDEPEPVVDPGDTEVLHGPHDDVGDAPGDDDH